jgi:NADH-quinone oxidoreductase subunit M
MIQRVFYSDLGRKPAKVAGWDLDAREHLALWPMVALFLVMGLASRIWLKAIDATVLTMADHPAAQTTAAIHSPGLAPDASAPTPLQAANGGAR